MDHVISIAPDGSIKTLWTDRIDLREFGTPHVERASNVEWDEQCEGWTVQFPDGMFLSQPARGWCCGVHAEKGFHGEVFSTREEALAAEVAFLQARL